MKNKFIWNLVNSVLVAILFVLLIVTITKKEQGVVYLNNIKLFSGFNMTKDLGKLNEKKYEARIKRFDSLVNEFTKLETKLKEKTQKLSKAEEEQYVAFHKVLRGEEQEIEAIRVQVKNEINKKVWNRLNSYIKEYGKKNKLKLILGAQGNGNIMYGDSLQDITQQFIAYANKKYEGE